MKCSFCGVEFREDTANKGCSGCALSNGCRKIKCPRCNYEMMPEAGLVKLVKKWVKKS
ncbi:hypothetical protein [Desulfotomaculum nigrificans]|uniref:hypothetical protein n=1 Tax=Desulfotomaculum nigrificans TaxID=1565 RepID=UPI0003032882|nr:hypothetical protein [Desulfotomaculum nigrificans]MDA8235923.1 hypothetical protein [Clostridia bacterium]